jgi:GNAT superfamily N-acetyltransferase
MIDEVIFVDKTRETRKEDWLIYEEGGDGLVGVAYYAVNVMSDETRNLYLTALHPKYQRAGIGSKLVKNVEEALIQHAGRILLIETSFLLKFEATKLFYSKYGFHYDERIGELHTAGEDKIVLWKLIESHASLLRR